MPIIQDTVSVGANATNNNLLSGSVFEYLPFNAMVEIGVVIPTGSTPGDIVAEILSGSDVLAQEWKPSNNGTIDTDRDLYLEDFALAGDRLVLKCRNTTAGAIDVTYLVRLTEA